ncbi:hypothetical protein HanPI659440_Chr09g0320771 [Helianthus annuus]|nr:hypothetical protein HanPI659440_Chr09g0320771 [Helianthus annuus]
MSSLYIQYYISLGLITHVIDQQGNNILHMVGKIPEKDAYKGWVAPPFRMFHEFLWYKEVKGMLSPQYRDVKNEAGKSPQELFTENHEKLVLEVVFQIPRGFDQNVGFPMFLHNNYFNQFVLLDIGSLSSLRLQSSFSCSSTFPINTKTCKFYFYYGGWSTSTFGICNVHIHCFYYQLFHFVW